MIDERDLAAHLQEVAAAYEPPADGPDRVVAAARAGRAGRAGRRRPGIARLRPTTPRQWLLAAAAAFVVVAVVGSLLGGDGDGGARLETAALGGEATGGEVPRMSRSLSDPVSLMDGQAALDAEATGGGFASGGAVPAPPAPALSGVLAQPAGDTARIVKTGSVEVEVAKGGFERAVTRLASVATGANGFVADSSTSEDEGGARGQVTVRVPSASFEQVVAEARRLGDVRNATLGGQDVTAEFTDLEARLRSLQATRDQFLTLLRQAKTVPDILGVQDRVNQVQLEIEQAQGRLNQLTDQTSFGTLTVVLFEAGADSPVRTEAESGLAGAWQDAKDGFVDGVEAVVAGSGTGLFALLVLLVLGMGARGAWHLTRRRLV